MIPYVVPWFALLAWPGQARPLIMEEKKNSEDSDDGFPRRDVTRFHAVRPPWLLLTVCYEKRVAFWKGRRRLAGVIE